ncbi:MAG TPA: ABC transporter permease subunit [Candidatus Saccharimonadales bacterium]|nr:ABC transporter permease subunit [Candidatus Saccharimonadales bacterium]
MNKSILFVSLWTTRKSTFFWSLGLFLIVVMVVALYDSMAKQYDKMLVDMPAGFEAIAGQIGSIGTPEGWLGVEVFGMVLPIALAIIGIGAGASAVGREESSGTLELLLASPMSRGRILLEKACAIAIQLALVSFATWLAVAFGVWFMSFEVSLTTVFYATFSGWLLGVLFAFIALAVQTATGSRGLALGIGAALLILGYFSHTLAPLVESIEVAKYFSPFYYYDARQILTDGLTVGHVAVLAASSAVALAVAYIFFQRRDVNV